MKLQYHIRTWQDDEQNNLHVTNFVVFCSFHWPSRKLPLLLSDLVTRSACLVQEYRKWYLLLMHYWPVRVHWSNDDRTGSSRHIQISQQINIYWNLCLLYQTSLTSLDDLHNSSSLIVLSACINIRLIPSHYLKQKELDILTEIGKRKLSHYIL